VPDGHAAPPPGRGSSPRQRIRRRAQLLFDQSYDLHDLSRAQSALNNARIAETHCGLATKSIALVDHRDGQSSDVFYGEVDSLPENAKSCEPGTRNATSSLCGLGVAGIGLYQTEGWLFKVIVGSHQA
jgi:hypothetical protein